MYTCDSQFLVPNTFRFENCLLKMEEFKWSQQETTNTLEQLNDKLVSLKKVIKEWRKERIGDVHIQEEVCMDRPTNRNKENNQFGGIYLKNTERTLPANRYIKGGNMETESKKTMDSKRR
jgi:hypothetical protein